MKSTKILLILMAFTGLIFCQPPARNHLHLTKDSSQAEVIGGSAATAQDFPYLVNIWLNSPGDSFVDHLCGATLIHPHWVLTAAHCVLEDVSHKSRGVVKLNEVSMFLGSLERTGAGGRHLTAKSIRVHPNFSWPKFDMALIELNETVEDVAPIALNQSAIEDFSHQPMATATGWGLTDEQGKIDPEFLQRIDLPLISREACRRDSYVTDKKWTIETDMLCAQTHQGMKATCAGDSGGPLIQKRNGQDVQIGIISWGSACRPAFHGHQSSIEGYSDVSAAYSWIQKQISD